MRDRLFVHRPGFVDPKRGPGTFFCPYCANVMGFLGYYPRVKDTLEIVELEFPRPRAALVALVGEAHQGTPLLVLGDEHEVPPGIPVGVANGRRFIEKTLDIMSYLSATRGVPAPHP